MGQTQSAAANDGSAQAPPQSIDAPVVLAVKNPKALEKKTALEIPNAKIKIVHVDPEKREGIVAKHGYIALRVSGNNNSNAAEHSDSSSPLTRSMRRNNRRYSANNNNNEDSGGEGIAGTSVRFAGVNNNNNNNSDRRRQSLLGASGVIRGSMRGDGQHPDNTFGAGAGGRALSPSSFGNSNSMSQHHQQQQQQQRNSPSAAAFGASPLTVEDFYGGALSKKSPNNNSASASPTAAAQSIMKKRRKELTVNHAALPTAAMYEEEEPPEFSDEIIQELKQLRQELRDWKRKFYEKNERMPGRAEMYNNPEMSEKANRIREIEELQMLAGAAKFMEGGAGASLRMARSMQIAGGVVLGGGGGGGGMGSGSGLSPPELLYDNANPIQLAASMELGGGNNNNNVGGVWHQGRGGGGDQEGSGSLWGPSMVGQPLFAHNNNTHTNNNNSNDDDNANGGEGGEEGEDGDAAFASGSHSGGGHNNNNNKRNTKRARAESAMTANTNTTAVTNTTTNTGSQPLTAAAAISRNTNLTTVGGEPGRPTPTTLIPSSGVSARTGHTQHHALRGGASSDGLSSRTGRRGLGVEPVQKYYCPSGDLLADRIFFQDQGQPDQPLEVKGWAEYEIEENEIHDVAGVKREEGDPASLTKANRKRRRREARKRARALARASSAAAAAAEKKESDNDDDEDDADEDDDDEEVEAEDPLSTYQPTSAVLDALVTAIQAPITQFRYPDADDYVFQGIYDPATIAKMKDFRAAALEGAQSEFDQNLYEEQQAQLMAGIVAAGAGGGGFNATIGGLLGAPYAMTSFNNTASNMDMIKRLASVRRPPTAPTTEEEQQKRPSTAAATAAPPPTADDNVDNFDNNDNANTTTAATASQAHLGGTFSGGLAAALGLNPDGSEQTPEQIEKSKNQLRKKLLKQLNDWKANFEAKNLRQPEIFEITQDATIREVYALYTQLNKEWKAAKRKKEKEEKEREKAEAAERERKRAEEEAEAEKVRQAVAAAAAEAKKKEEEAAAAAAAAAAVTSVKIFDSTPSKSQQRAADDVSGSTAGDPFADSNNNNGKSLFPSPHAGRLQSLVPGVSPDTSALSQQQRQLTEAEQAELKVLNKRVRVWKKNFKEHNGRNPNRTDIRNSEDICDDYFRLKELQAIEEGGGGKGSDNEQQHQNNNNATNVNVDHAYAPLSGVNAVDEATRKSRSYWYGLFDALSAEERVNRRDIEADEYIDWKQLIDNPRFMEEGDTSNKNAATVKPPGAASFASDLYDLKKAQQKLVEGAIYRGRRPFAEEQEASDAKFEAEEEALRQLRRQRDGPDADEEENDNANNNKNTNAKSIEALEAAAKRKAEAEVEEERRLQRERQEEAARKREQEAADADEKNLKKKKKKGKGGDADDDDDGDEKKEISPALAEATAKRKKQLTRELNAWKAAFTQRNNGKEPFSKDIKRDPTIAPVYEEWLILSKGGTLETVEAERRKSSSKAAGNSTLLGANNSTNTSLLPPQPPPNPYALWTAEQQNNEKKALIRRLNAWKANFKLEYNREPKVADIEADVQVKQLHDAFKLLKDLEGGGGGGQSPSASPARSTVGGGGDGSPASATNNNAAADGTTGEQSQLLLQLHQRPLHSLSYDEASQLAQRRHELAQALKEWRAEFTETFGRAPTQIDIKSDANMHANYKEYNAIPPDVVNRHATLKAAEAERLTKEKEAAEAEEKKRAAAAVKQSSPSSPSAAAASPTAVTSFSPADAKRKKQLNKQLNAWKAKFIESSPNGKKPKASDINADPEMRAIYAELTALKEKEELSEQQQGGGGGGEDGDNNTTPENTSATPRADSISVSTNADRSLFAARRSIDNNHHDGGDGDNSNAPEPITPGSAAQQEKEQGEGGFFFRKAAPRPTDDDDDANNDNDNNDAFSSPSPNGRRQPSVSGEQTNRSTNKSSPSAGNGGAVGEGEEVTMVAAEDIEESDLTPSSQPPPSIKVVAPPPPQPPQPVATTPSPPTPTIEPPPPASAAPVTTSPSTATTTAAATADDSNVRAISRQPSSVAAAVASDAATNNIITNKKQLAKALQQWKDDFKAANGREPTKGDINNDPIAGPLYKQFMALKKDGGGGGGGEASEVGAASSVATASVAPPLSQPAAADDSPSLLPSPPQQQQHQLPTSVIDDNNNESEASPPSSHAMNKKQLAKALQQWKDDFKAANGRDPTKGDINNDPIAGPLYKQFMALKKDGGGGGNDAHHEVSEVGGRTASIVSGVSSSAATATKPTFPPAPVGERDEEGGDGAAAPATTTNTNTAAVVSLSAAAALADVASTVVVPPPHDNDEGHRHNTEDNASDITATNTASVTSPYVLQQQKELQNRKKQLNKQLNEWKQAFQAAQGRPPKGADIQQEPEMAAMYEELRSIKTQLGGD